MHTVRRSGVYYYRRRIPSDLRPAHEGHREVFYSLHTRDRAEAERKARRISVGLDDRWASFRGQGPEADRPIDIAALTPPTVARTSSSSGLSRLLALWQKERTATAKTIDQYSRAVAEFNAQHRSPSIRSINRAMVIAYRDSLRDQGKAIGTINDRISIIRALLAIAVDRSLVQVNSAAAAALPADARAIDARKPYSREEVEAVLNGTEQFRHSHPARFWLPRLARWTGARLNELHQLRRRDLEERSGTRGICITADGECLPGLAMRLKNGGSQRWIPLHAAVEDFWDWAQRRPEGALFPDKPNVYGIISDNFSKWYGRQRVRWGLTNPRVAFHSWRHGFADMCRAAGVAPEVRMALMGHAEAGVAGSYGSGELPAILLIEAVRRLSAER